MTSLPTSSFSPVSPDVTVIVGNEEFEEYSRELCCWADYFYAAVRSGMEETRTLKFEFPHRDPEEWKLIRSLMKPFATEKVTADNMDVALSWFDELRCEHGLKECDRVLNRTILSIIHPQKQTTVDRESMIENVDHFLDTLSRSIQYGLEQSKQSCIATLVRVIEEAPKALNEERLKALLSCVRDDDDSSNILWVSLSRHLPGALANKSKEERLENVCLPALIAARTQADVLSSQLRRLLDIARFELSASGLVQVKRDSFLRDVVPRDW